MEFVELIRALAWPLVVVVGLLAFYRPLYQFLTDVGKRVTKLSAWGVEIGLRPMVEGHVEPLRQLRQDALSASGGDILLNALSSTAKMDYAVIDLGAGRSWLTSRLFLFGVMLQELRGLRCFVFVESSSPGRRRFVGTALPNQLRWQFAKRFPWLESTFATQYDVQVGAPQPGKPPAPLSEEKAAALVTTFILLLQTPEPPPEPDSGWATLPPDDYGLQLSEHADWITPQNLPLFLGTALVTSKVDNWSALTQEQLVKAILRAEGNFVALLDANGDFVKLEDRRALLEQLATRAASDPA